MLPKVRETVKRMYECGDERSRRITVSAVRKEMGLPDKRFDKLPKCKEEILKYQESQKEYWAREAVWAYRKLIEEGQAVNWTHMRNLTNMRNENFQSCKQYLWKYAEEKEQEILGYKAGILGN